jgi:hydrogenase small subunit
MNISRRDFLRYCTISAAALGLSSTELGMLEKALASTTGPSVLWLEGAACTGCSVSLLNRISSAGPKTTADVLINSINLVYHNTIMAAAGDLAVAQAEATYQKGGYVLAIAGAVPTAFNGFTAIAWKSGGQYVPFKDVVTKYASRAAKILSIGTCASFGGIPGSTPNPTGARSVAQHTGKATINLSGCPPHPDWMVWAIAQLLAGANISLDSTGRPSALYGPVECENCRRYETDWATTFGMDNNCLRGLGCRGPATHSYCTRDFWNNKQNVCQEANAPCVGCVEPSWPTTGLYVGIDGTTGASTTTGGETDDGETDDGERAAVGAGSRRSGRERVDD